MSQLAYVLPVHNEERVLVASVARVVRYLERYPGAEVYLVENGSSDRSWEIAEELEDESQANAPTNGAPYVRVRAFREAKAGIGYAYQRGLVEAVAAFGPSKSRWAVLTAADLPFGFSDLEAAMVLLERAPSRIFMGSKAHADSHVATALKRRAMSAVYRAARRAVLGMRVGDSQGSVFVRLDLADELTRRVESRGFFYSTELCHYAEQMGESIIELPVVIEGEQRASTVKPVKHGLEMARQLFDLRKRSKEQR